MTKKAIELITKGKHFCILPWIHFHAWPDKRVMPCCVADSNKPVSKIRSDESIIQMMNSEEYKKMRVAMLNDEPVEACQRCYDLEKVGTWTMRVSHNKRRGLDFVDEVEATNNDGSINEFKMKYMDIRFSNLCNMKCRSCGPSCSSQWAQEFIEHKGVNVLNQYFGITKMVVNNNEDQQFMLKLKPYLKDVVEVYFAGGEIIITPEHYECLDFWIENNLQDNIELTYTTNFSALKYKDKDLISYWKKFPKLKIWASLDAEGDVAEILRKGTDWDRIVKNIKELREAVPHAEFEITPTVSIWNVFSFPTFFDNLIEQGLINKHCQPRFNLATHPWYANVQILPEFTKTKLIDLYEGYIEKYSYNHHVKDGFQLIQQAIKGGSPAYAEKIDRSNKGGIQEFMKFNDELDSIRKEKLLDAVPELKEVFEWANS